ncbi:MAG: aminomethyl-transferring glycine dehydrogenase subunit GcvPB [Firmicutes bacterium]|nr:aminomethyl-transferring glycine dehydrogenase subunit GcvPB [Bacillota bacterium]
MSKDLFSQTEALIFDKSRPGHKAYFLPEMNIKKLDKNKVLPSHLIRKICADLPEVSEIDVVRHFTHLSTKNFGVDTGFYPLGSCTMKYNPKLNENTARLPGFSWLHPYQPVETVQGALQLMYLLQVSLAEITGMDKVTLQPAAGAHGELTGIKIIKAYHDSRGDTKRTKIIVPDSAHGTNPATATMAGFQVVEIKSSPQGDIDLDALKAVVGDDTAGFMLTNPSTLGLFERNIKAIAEIIHGAGGLLYYDGANTNAIMGITRPGDMGFDVVHVNLHKTFATPHGGGGPGSGPVGVKEFLAKFLPIPTVEYIDYKDKYVFNYDVPETIGRMKSFYGNFPVIVRAYTYIRALGYDGLKKSSEYAVLNANYLKKLVGKHLSVEAPDRFCMHEFICTPKNIHDTGVHTLDIAKRMIDYGYHPPTIYFPLIVEEAMMIEPTETEGIETLKEFAEVVGAIVNECKTNAEMVKTAPHTTYVKRLDEVKAAREPNLRYRRPVVE